MTIGNDMLGFWISILEWNLQVLITVVADEHHFPSARSATIKITLTNNFIKKNKEWRFLKTSTFSG